MAFEGLICPSCSGALEENDLAEKLVCPQCKIDFRHKKFLGFLEYLMMQGIVADIDFFDKSIYGDEIRHSTETEKELKDETNPDEYEDKSFRMKFIDDNPELAEEANKDDGIKNSYKISTSQEGVEEEEEDWQEFNKRNRKDQKHGSRKKKK